MYEKIRVLPGGDPEGGWLIDIHDGTNSAVYSPAGADVDAAVTAALADHRKAFPAATQEIDTTAIDAFKAALEAKKKAAEPKETAPVSTTVEAAPAAAVTSTEPAQNPAG